MIALRDTDNDSDTQRVIFVNTKEGGKHGDV